MRRGESITQFAEMAHSTISGTLSSVALYLIWPIIQSQLASILDIKLNKNNMNFLSFFLLLGGSSYCIALNDEEEDNKIS